MLKKSFRLTKNKKFDQVFKIGHSFFGIFLGIKALKNQENTNHYGVLVGLKVSKLAVRRNLVKRRIKAVLAQEDPKLARGYDVVIITKPEIINNNYASIKEEIERGLKKLKLYV